MNRFTIALVFGLLCLAGVSAQPPGFKAQYVVKLQNADPANPGKWNGYSITVNWNGGYWEGTSADGLLYTQLLHSQDELKPLNFTNTAWDRAKALNVPNAIGHSTWGEMAIPQEGKPTVPPQIIYKATIN